MHSSRVQKKWSVKSITWDKGLQFSLPNWYADCTCSAVVPAHVIEFTLWFWEYLTMFWKIPGNEDGLHKTDPRSIICNQQATPVCTQISYRNLDRLLHNTPIQHDCHWAQPCWVDQTEDHVLPHSKIERLRRLGTYTWLASNSGITSM